MKRHIKRLTAAIFAVLVTILAEPVPGRGQGAGSPQPDEFALNRKVPVDARITTGHLDNDLRYWIRENVEPKNRAELRLVVHAGSVLEDDDQRGLAHFVEHLAFNGSEHFPRQALVDFMESIGMRFGADLNASTGFDETVYQLRIPTDSRDILEKSFLILEDWAHGVTFDPQAVDKERGIILEEWRLGQGAAVAVIEALTKEKYTHIGGEVGTVNCQYNLDHGAPRIDEEDFLREWARRNIIRHNPKRASYFVKNSGRILDWVIKDMSKEWLAENSHTMSCPPKPGVLLEVSEWKFYFGTIIFRKMTDPIGVWRWTEVLKTHNEKAMADGAKWFFEHHAEVCDVDASGAVTGVVAKTSDGNDRGLYVRREARSSVVLEERRRAFTSFAKERPHFRPVTYARGCSRLGSAAAPSFQKLSASILSVG